MTGSAAVELYWFELDGAQGWSADQLDLLHPDERLQAQRFEQPAAANLFVQRRVKLRTLLGKKLRRAPKTLSIRRPGLGKPQLVEPEIHFSASNTRSQGVVAISTDGPIGVDIEQVRPVQTASLADGILSVKERCHLAGLCPDQKLATLFDYWTAKEAVIKAQGDGLNLNTMRQLTICSDRRDDGWREVKSEAPSSWFVLTQALPLSGGKPTVVSIAAQQPAPLQIMPSID